MIVIYCNDSRCTVPNKIAMFTKKETESIVSDPTPKGCAKGLLPYVREFIWRIEGMEKSLLPSNFRVEAYAEIYE